MKHESRVLKGNPCGDPHVRDLVVYTPPAYEAGSESFPAAYCLTGFTGRGIMLMNQNSMRPTLAERMDTLIAAGTIKPMIVVMPDCFTFYGGSQYINSTATGNYEDYLVDEIVPFIDDNFRTHSRAGSRAAFGISSGGYGSLIMGMRHADVFGVICSHAGDNYFEYSQMADFAKAFRRLKGVEPKEFVRNFWANEQKDSADFPALNAIGMAACYSPNGADFDMPFDLETGEIREDVWARWLAHDPVRLVEKHVENLKSLRLLYLDAGDRDEFALDIGARVFASRLRDHGIEHIHEEFKGGHFDLSFRYNHSLALMSERMLRD